MGSAFKVYLDRELKAGETVDIIVEYSTTKDCTALGWLKPEQTASGLYPFLYSQCQAIHARSLLPCQDTPAIKSTYTATVRSPLPIIMSAIGVSPSREEISDMVTKGAINPSSARVYSYEQKVAIPSYLIAIAGGEVAFAVSTEFEVISTLI